MAKESKTKKYLKYAGVAAIGAIVAGAGVSMIPVDNTAILADSFAAGVASVDTDAVYAEGVASVPDCAEVPVCDVCEVCAEPVVCEVITSEDNTDSGNLKLVLEEIYDNDGSVEYLTEDLDDDELYLIADRIIFIQEAKNMAIDHVKAELADELNNVEITMNDNSTVELDEDDFEKLRIDDDSDEILVANVDYEDKDVDVTVTGRFRHDDTWFAFEAKVAIEDNEVDDFDIISVTEE